MKERSANVTGKEYLSGAARINNKLKAMAEQLAYLKSAAQYISPQITDKPKPTTHKAQKSEDAMIRVINFESKMQEEHKKLSEINLVINAVENSDQQRVLVKRYICEMSWVEIAKAMCLSEAKVYKLHRAALEMVEEILKNTVIYS